jgi:hypothetical protein
MCSCPVNLKLQKFALSLEKPSPKIPDFLRGKHEASESKNGAVIMFGVTAADVGADVTKLIQVCDVDFNYPLKHESPRFRVGLGKRATFTAPLGMNN